MSDRVDDSPTLDWGRRFLLLGALCAVGVLCGLLLMPEPQAHAAQPVQVAVAGMSLRPTKQLAEQANALAQRYLGGSISLRAAGVEQRLRRADLGVAVDLAHLRALLERADDPASALRRAHEALLAGRPLSLPMPAELDLERAKAWLFALKDKVDRAASDAHVDPRKKLALPAQAGLALDVYASLERIDRALARGDVEVELATLATPARRGAERLAQLSMDAVVGEFTTRYARGPDLHDRIHNLHVAAQKLDGYVIEPGEIFDFNAVVGDRTELNGFRMAKVIADGELVEGMGGGTCQIASTLHAAAFFAGLPIVERHPHSHPSFYIKLGLDSTVVYGSQNLRFENDRPYPLVIELEVEDGFVRAALLGKERTRTVTFLRRIDEVTPFVEKLVPDESMPHKMRILQQRGIPGFKITSFRVVRDETTGLARRERMSDIYPPTSQVWRVGKGGEPGPDFRAPKNDGHPEYVADEFMSATQGPRTDGIEVSATAGRTGVFGWTERQNMMRSSAGAAAPAP